MPPRAWGALSTILFGLMVLAWGGNYLFVRIGELYVDPLWLATLRASVGAAGIGAFLALRPGTAPLSARDARDAALLGIPNTAVFLGLWFVAAPAVAPGETAVIVYTFPLWVALVSPSLLGLGLGRRHWLAIAVGFAGVVLVSEPWSAGIGGDRLVPFVELLAAAVSWAVATVLFQRRFEPAVLPRANGVQLLGGAAALAVAAIALGDVRGSFAAPGLWISVVWLGLFGTAFAYGVWFHLLRTVHAPALSAYSFLVPLTTLALSAALFGERLSLVQLLGVVLVLSGIFLVGSSRFAVVRRPSRSSKET